MAPDEIEAALARAAAKRDELVAQQPAAKLSAKVLLALPAAMEAYRRRVRAGLDDADPRVVVQARGALRQLVGGRIDAQRPAGSKWPVLRFQNNRLPLLRAAGADVGLSGSGGRI